MTHQPSPEEGARPFDPEPHRIAFETQCWSYYQGLKAKGWSDPGEGDDTPAALFWRTDEGRYGVHSVEQAWQGFVMGAKHYYPSLATYGGALQELGNYLGLPAGTDLPTMLLPCCRSLGETGRLAVRILFDWVQATEAKHVEKALTEAEALVERMNATVRAREGRPH